MSGSGGPGCGPGDRRKATGRVRYTADVTVPGCLHASFVRSPVPSGVLSSVDIGTAASMAGVIGVWTGGEVSPADVVDRIENGRAALPDAVPVLAARRVVYEGQPVVLVVAESAAAAELAADRVVIEYEVVEPRLSVEDPAEDRGETGLPAGAAFRWESGDADAVEATMSRSATVVTRTFRRRALSMASLEPWACIADWDPDAESMSIHVTTAAPFMHRTVLAAWLGLAENRCRVVAAQLGGPDSRGRSVHPETLATAWASRQTGRPVRWQADPRATFLVGAHGPGQIIEGTLALDEDGRFGALRLRVRSSAGASLPTFGAQLPDRIAAAVSALPYAIRSIRLDVEGVFTNTAPSEIDAEPGCPEVTGPVERLVDLAAADRGMDPAQLRGLNLKATLPAGEAGAPPLAADNASNENVLDQLLDRLGYAGERVEQSRFREQGRYRGIGMTCYTGVANAPPVSGGIPSRPVRSARIRIEPTGVVSGFSGLVPGHSGLEAALTRTIAERVGGTSRDVTVHLGDTALAPYDAGWPGLVDARAMEACADALRQKVAEAAAELLGVRPSELEMSGGTWGVKGSAGRRLTLSEIASSVHYGKAGEGALEATSHLRDETPSLVHGAHGAVVEIDPETGQVRLLRYVAIEQGGADAAAIRAGVVRGLGPALWEASDRTSEGKLSTDSMMKYAVPRADQLPRIEAERIGSIGPGTASAAAATATVANAVMDALSTLEVGHIDAPFTSAAVWSAIQRAKEGAD